MSVPHARGLDSRRLSRGWHRVLHTAIADSTVTDGGDVVAAEQCIVDKSDAEWRALQYVREWCGISSAIDDEFLRVLHTLEYTIAQEPVAADLLARISSGPVFLSTELPVPTEAERRPPKST